MLGLGSFIGAGNHTSHALLSPWWGLSYTLMPPIHISSARTCCLARVAFLILTSYHCMPHARPACGPAPSRCHFHGPLLQTYLKRPSSSLPYIFPQMNPFCFLAHILQRHQEPLEPFHSIGSLGCQEGTQGFIR